MTLHKEERSLVGLTLPYLGWDTEKGDVFASTLAFLKEEKVPVG